MAKSPQLFDRSRVPLYLQVASVLRQRIDVGHWAEGARISTLEQLEEEFSVARVTVRQAVELLRTEGLLDAQQGRGTFVSAKAKKNRWLNLSDDFEAMLASIRENVLKRVHINERPPQPVLHEEEGRLASEYVFLRSVQYNTGDPFSVVNLHLDKRIYLRDRKSFMSSAALPQVIEMNDIKISNAIQTLTVGVADQNTAELLKIGLGEATADCRLVLIDESGVAIYVADIHYMKNCLALRIDLLGQQRSRKARKR